MRRKTRDEPGRARVRILKPGLFTTVQDLGRPGYQRFGMPIGGAMDPLALRLANRLVGNPDGAAALEITMSGPVLEFAAGAVFAVTGADLSPTLDGQPVPLWTAVAARAGSRLAFGARRAGARAYLGVAGGLDVPIVLGSRSTHPRSGTGGLAGRALRAGDDLRSGPPGADAARLAGRTVPPAVRPRYTAAPTLRVVLGPQADGFPPETIETLRGSRYVLSPQCDRMGYRLLGPALAHVGPAEIISEATPMGALQVPANGQPILLMADRQTTGGYPVIAVVISADLPLAAQLAPGDTVAFTAVSVPEAQTLLREQRARLDAAVPPEVISSGSLP
ncbi:5-oxoprolinase subunit C family protein [Nitrospira sp. Kam-Ns4a]